MIKLLQLPILLVILFYNTRVLNVPETHLPRKAPAARQYTVTATVYHADPKQCNAEFNITADGSIIDTLNPSRHRWVAISRDMSKRYGGEFNFGDTLMIKGTNTHLDGIHIVRDLMNKRYRNRIDFLVSKDDIYGKWDNIKIYRHADVKSL